jgi:hypothetical protein
MNTNDPLYTTLGQDLLKSYNKGPKTSFQEMERCVKISGTP